MEEVVSSLVEVVLVVCQCQLSVMLHSALALLHFTALLCTFTFSTTYYSTTYFVRTIIVSAVTLGNIVTSCKKIIDNLVTFE